MEFIVKIIEKISKLIKRKKEHECCLNCFMIDRSDGPFCSNVYGMDDGGTSEISENFWCKNYSNGLE